MKAKVFVGGEVPDFYGATHCECVHCAVLLQ